MSQEARHKIDLTILFLNVALGFADFLYKQNLTALKQRETLKMHNLISLLQ